MVSEDSTCTRAFIDAAVKQAALMPQVEVLLIIAYNYAADAYISGFTYGDLRVHCLRANRDLMIDGLEFGKSDQAFVEIGEPRLDVMVRGDRVRVRVGGFDTFNPRTGNLSEGTKDNIDCWMIDTDYNENSFYARRFHFPGRDGDRQIARFLRAFKRVVDNDEVDAMRSLESTWFAKPSTGRIAVKIVTTTGVEMMAVRDIV